MKYKTILIYQSPVPYHTVMSALSQEALAGRYDKTTDVQYFVFEEHKEPSVVQICASLGVTRAKRAVFESNGKDLGIQMSARRNQSVSDTVPSHLVEVSKTKH